MGTTDADFRLLNVESILANCIGPSGMEWASSAVVVASVVVVLPGRKRGALRLSWGCVRENRDCTSFEVSSSPARIRIMVGTMPCIRCSITSAGLPDVKARRTYRQLSDGIVHDVERVESEEVERHFADEGDGVYHARLDDDDEDSPVAETCSASAQTEQIPIPVI